MHFSTAAAATTALLIFIAPASAQEGYIVNDVHAWDTYLFNAKDLSGGGGHSWTGHHQRRPTIDERHGIDFTVTRPNTVQQQGGNGVFRCRVEWQGREPKSSSCYTPCIATGVGLANSQYWARVTPGAGRNKAVDMSVDLLQEYTWRWNFSQNGTFVLKDQETGSYGCEKDYDRGTSLTQRCEFKEDPKTVGVRFDTVVFFTTSVVETC